MITTFSSIYVNLLYLIIVTKTYHKQYQKDEELLKTTKNIMTYVILIMNMYYGGFYIMQNKTIITADIILLTLITISTICIFSCKWTLGKLYKFRKNYTEDHHIITTGLYKYFVHPSVYFHNILLISIMLFLQYPYHLIVSLQILNYLIDRNRILKEEDLMYYYFDAEYIDYRTRRWLP